MNGRRFGLWTLLVALSAAPGLARDQRSRPLLAPVALEARCPLADGTWQLGPVAKIATRPAAAPQRSEKAADAPAPAQPETEDVAAVAHAAEPAPDAEPRLCEPFPPVPSEEKIDALLGEYLPYDLKPRDRYRLRLFPLALPQLSYLPGIERAVESIGEPAAAPQCPQRTAPAEADLSDACEAADQREHVAACFPIEPNATVPAEAGKQAEAGKAAEVGEAVVQLHGPPAPAALEEPQLPPSLVARFGGIDCFVDEMVWRAGRLVETLPQDVRRMVRQLGRKASGPALALHRTSERFQQLALDAANASSAAPAEAAVVLSAPSVPSAPREPAAEREPIVRIEAWASSGRSVCCPVAQNAEYGGLYDKRFEDPRSSAVDVPAPARPADATLRATADTLDAVAGWLQGLSRSLRNQSQRIAQNPDAAELR